MEKLINSIPKEKIISRNKETGENQITGICLKYSTGLKKWVVGYGRSYSQQAIDEGYWAGANDPVEALADFVELLNKQTNK